jgi:hypothetical protein
LEEHPSPPYPMVQILDLPWRPGIDSPGRTPRETSIRVRTPTRGPVVAQPTLPPRSDSESSALGRATAHNGGYFVLAHSLRQGPGQTIGRSRYIRLVLLIRGKSLQAARGGVRAGWAPHHRAGQGLNRVFTFALAPFGNLAPSEPPSVQARAASGPRHVAFHPTGDLAM